MSSGCIPDGVNVVAGEAYTHKEDFFFRTVHLGSEAWAFVATQRIISAKHCAAKGRWHLAAARALQVRQANQLLCCFRAARGLCHHHPLILAFAETRQHIIVSTLSCPPCVHYSAASCAASTLNS